MYIIRKGQVRWLSGSGVRRQNRFINELFDVAASSSGERRPFFDPLFQSETCNTTSCRTIVLSPSLVIIRDCRRGPTPGGLHPSWDPANQIPASWLKY